jgi:hypothetical protein
MTFTEENLICVPGLRVIEGPRSLLKLRHGRRKCASIETLDFTQRRYVMFKIILHVHTKHAKGG